jgi:single-strand DNA-binding protein
MNLNEVTLIGYVGKEPTMSGDGKKPFASVSLGTNKRVKKGEEFETQTTWHKLVFFGDLVEQIKQHAKKGTGLFVKGELENHGVTHHISQIVVRKFCFIDNKNSESA